MKTKVYNVFIINCFMLVKLMPTTEKLIKNI